MSHFMFMGHGRGTLPARDPCATPHKPAMARSAALDDSGTRDTVVSHIAGGGTQDTAAQLLGIGRTTITRRMSADPVFGERVRAARSRARALGLEQVRATPANLEMRKTAARAVERDGIDLGLPSPKWVVDLLKETAQNPEAKGQARAQLLLAELVVAPVVRARNAKLEQPEAAEEHLQVRLVIGQAKRPRMVDVPMVDAKTESGS